MQKEKLKTWGLVVLSAAVVGLLAAVVGLLVLGSPLRYKAYTDDNIQKSRQAQQIREGKEKYWQEQAEIEKKRLEQPQMLTLKFRQNVTQNIIEKEVALLYVVSTNKVFIKTDYLEQKITVDVLKEQFRLFETDIQRLQDTGEKLDGWLYLIYQESELFAQTNGDKFEVEQPLAKDFIEYMQSLIGELS